RPSVVVAAVRVGAAVEQLPDVREAARHAEEVVPVRAARLDELGVRVEERGERGRVPGLECAVGEHERRGGLGAGAGGGGPALPLLPARIAPGASAGAPGPFARDPAPPRAPPRAG